MFDFETADDVAEIVRKHFVGYDRSLRGKLAAINCTDRLYAALRECAELSGMKPNIEVHRWSPDDGQMQGCCWGASWEAGPYQWAIPISFLIMDLTGRLTEPYWSFDLCFYAAE